MVLVKVEKSELKRASRTNLYKLLDEFVASGYDCARIEGAADHYASANSGQTTIQAAIKRYKFKGCKVTAQNGEFYLIKEKVI